jgi:hypothetical protein
MTATSQPSAAASASRAASSAVCAPWRRCAGAVAAPGELRDALADAHGGAARGGDREALGACPVAGGLAAAGDQLRFGPLDAPG